MTHSVPTIREHDGQRLRRFAGYVCWLCVSAAICAIAFAGEVCGQQLTPRLFSPTELITRLDSPRFQERNSATRELVALGESGLRPLVKGYLGSSPEQAWRIRQIIRQICVQGDEATFFKAAAVLRLLCGSGLAGQEVDKLREQWMDAKSDRALEELKLHGAVVTLVSDPNEGMNDLMIVMNQGNAAEEPKAAEATGGPAAKPTVPLTQAELLSAVDEILVAAVTDNRKLALGLSAEDAATVEATATDPEEAIQREVAGIAQQRVVIAGGNRIFVNPRGGYFYPEYANRIAFGPEWEGELKDFLNVVAVKGINSVELQGIELTAEQLQAVCRVASLQHVRIDGCRLSKNALEGLRGLSGVTNLSLANLTVTPDMEEVLGEFTSLYSLRLENITFQTGTFWKRFRNAPALFYLDLKQMTLTGDDLKQIGTLPGLQNLMLTWTKFPLAEYREFLAQNPTLRPQVVNRAFLGVRGGLTLVDQDQGPCVISEVIEDSAAAKGGMKVDDVVQQVDDQKVETFRELVMYVSNFNPGETIKVKVLREGKPLELDITLAERPPNAQ